jgi:hypothetical protein
MARKTPPPPGFFKRNGLTVVFALLTALALAGHALAGWRHENAERAERDLPAQTLPDYLGSGGFLSSLFENWESEFLQMGAFVLLTVWLRQRGSSESRPLDPADEEPGEPVPRSEQPWPVRRGGAWRRLYEHSLSLALFALFAVSFGAHLVSSWHAHREERQQIGQPAQPLSRYAGDPKFWFESFQNWQSEFLSVVALCLLSIWLREKDSPQSKAVTARHSDTGT